MVIALPLQLASGPATLNHQPVQVSYQVDHREPWFPHTLVALRGDKNCHTVATLDLQVNQDGVTFFGIVGKFKLFNGVNIPRYPKVNVLHWRGVTVIPSHGRGFADLAASTVTLGQKGQICLSFKFQKLGTFGITFAQNKSSIEKVTVPERFLD